MIKTKIHEAYNSARRYVESCCIDVLQDGKCIQAFTEYRGKNRVTDWGGTSSAINMLKNIGTSGTEQIKTKIEEAEKWLVSEQEQDGSWEAAEMQCCEATSAVIFDLADTNILSKNMIKRATNYIQKCYVQAGYFVSKPGISQIPHIYTTYLAVKALFHENGNNQLTKRQKKSIIEWIQNAQAADENWNATPQCQVGDTIHTIFALFILYYCGLSINQLKKQYKKQIKWIKKQIKASTSRSSAFSYEAIEVYDRTQNDKFGEGAHILKSYHFNTAALCWFFLKFEYYDIAQRLIMKLINMQSKEGGWGVEADGKIFVWATQQAINCMFEYEKKLINKNSLLDKIWHSTYTIPYFRIKLCVFIVLIPMVYWLIFVVQKAPDIMIGIIMLIIPWIVKNQD